MIKIENTVTPSPEQWRATIMGARNPMNSWDRSDSIEYTASLLIGEKDRDLMMILRNAGTDHRKFMRMITVYVDITAPLYLWKEFDTYKVGTVANSCSTMHKIHEKEFTLEDFSCEHLGVHTFACDENGNDVPVFQNLWEESLKRTIKDLNVARSFYDTTSELGLKKQYWWQMIQLLPSSYNQKRTVMLNYEVLANIYKSRKNHKLDEWRELCKWIESLPCSDLITGKDKERNHDNESVQGL